MAKLTTTTIYGDLTVNNSIEGTTITQSGVAVATQTWVSNNFNNYSLESHNNTYHSETYVTDAHFTGSTGISYSGGSISTNDSQINHNNLSNYSSNEHIDWTVTQTSNIHSDNYTNTTYTAGSGLTLTGTEFSLSGDSFNMAGTYANLRAQGTLKGDVGLGNVPNTNIAYASTIAADAFTSTEVTNLRSAKLDDGTTPWTSNNYYDNTDVDTHLSGGVGIDYSIGTITNTDTGSSAVSTHETTYNHINYDTAYNARVTGVSGSGDGTLTINRGGTTDVNTDLSHSHSEYITDVNKTDVTQYSYTSSDLSLGTAADIDSTISTSNPSGGANGDVWYQV